MSVLIDMARIASIPDEKGRQYLQPFFATDSIMGRKDAEQQIRKSKALLQAVFDGIADPMLILGEDFSVRMLNCAAAQYYGVREPQDCIGKRCYETFRKKAKPCKRCQYPSVLSEGHSKTFERKGLMDPHRFEQVVIYPLRHKKTQIGALVRIIDVTRAKLTERQLVESEKLASLGLLVAGLAHDITNLNNCITFNIPIMREYLKKLISIVDNHAKNHQPVELFGMSYPEFRKDTLRLLDNVEHASNRINTTVGGLKEFVRTRYGGEHRWIDLREVIEKGVAICRCQIKRSVRVLEVNIADDLPPIFTDPEALEQILVNLLINAAQAAYKEDSWIRLNVKMENTRPDHFIIEVNDNGCGMDKETKKKIFDAFFTTKPAGMGTGLGLFVSKNLIEALGGCITVESDRGKGTTFTF
jgi:signal transduction histidine kinase